METPNPLSPTPSVSGKLLYLLAYTPVTKDLPNHHLITYSSKALPCKAGMIVQAYKPNTGGAEVGGHVGSQLQ